MGFLDDGTISLESILSFHSASSDVSRRFLVRSESVRVAKKRFFQFRTAMTECVNDADAAGDTAAKVSDASDLCFFAFSIPKLRVFLRIF